MENKNNINLNLKNLSILMIFTFVLGGFFVYGGLILANNFGFNIGYNQAVNEESVSENIRVVQEESQVIEVVDMASKAVVSIVATAEVPTFETYYEDFGFFGFRMPQRRQSGTENVQVGAGTGFIVSSDGYIVTNKHVVADEDAEYTVYLNYEGSMGEKVVADVLALDPNNDLAILKIDKENLPYLEFGDSDNLKVGQTSITIGYALGEFDNTVSKGVISGLARSIVAGGSLFGRERLNDLIQSDAAINPGNSGGPMLDISGKVIGVNVAMASAENIGFAIPANRAKEAFEEVKETGSIQEKEIPFLGVRYMIINDNLKERNSLPFDYGALVLRGETAEDLAVMPGSPADKAGILENDIILEIDGKKIDQENTLAEIISEYEVGDEVKMKIYQKGEEKEVTVKLTKRP